MTQTNVPLYPKISSIYNKILQLAIAITCIIVLMNILLDLYSRQTQLIMQQQTDIGDQYITQAAGSTLVLFQEKNTALLGEHLKQLSAPDFINDTVLYDETGQVLHQYGDMLTVKELYGATTEQRDKNDNFQTFVIELRNKKLYGYLRMTIKRDTWQKAMISANNDNQEKVRIMLLIAGVIGFLLTRGLSRFSRQGYRLKRTNTN